MNTPTFNIAQISLTTLRFALALAVTSCMLSTSAEAVEKTWLGNNTSWTTGSNWSPSGTTSPGDDIIFGNQVGASSVSMVAASRTVRNLTWARTVGELNINPATNPQAAPIVLTISGSFVTNVNSSTFTLRSASTNTVNYNPLQITVGQDLTLNSFVRFGDQTASNVNSNSNWAESAIYGLSVGGTTTLNSGGVLQISRLMTASSGSNGTINLGSLNMNGGALYLFAGSTATTGAIVGTETTTTVSRLNGTSGTISGNKLAGGLTYGQLVVSGTQNGTFGGTISDGAVSASSQVRLTKGGSSTLTLTGTNTYTGTTTVSAGTLLVANTGVISNTSTVVVSAGARFINNSNATRTGAIVLNGSGTGSRAILGGTSTVGVALTLDNLGDTLSPGNSPGTLPLSVSQTWTSFTYEWETNDFTGTLAGTDFDQITIAGTLTLDGSAYALDIISLTGLNVVGDIANFSETNRTWTILTASGGITGFDSSEWSLLTNQFTSSPAWEGNWTLGQSGNSLVLSYNAVPEPSTYVLFGFGATCLLILRRRKRS